MYAEDLATFFLFTFAFSFLLAFIPAMIASRKGRSGELWWLFGFFLFIVALPAALLAEDLNTKKCPQCAERIKKQALKCRFCGYELRGGSSEDWTLDELNAASALNRSEDHLP